MREEVVDVVSPVPIGSSTAQSLYVLLPIKLREKRKFNTATSFAVIEAENGDVIYRKQGA